MDSENVKVRDAKVKSESFKWNEELKSHLIKIDGNVVKLTKQTTGQYAYCVLNPPLSNITNTKKSWTIQIDTLNNSIGWIYLGVCLKSKLIEEKFNEKDFNWNETGHGFYMIDSYGFCYSHSEKEFNNVFDSFLIIEGDVVYVEYDSVGNKLIFKNNNVEKFEMTIQTLPENDSYHPCVLFSGYYEAVELLQESVAEQ